MTLRIHHLNCGTLCPWCQRLINGTGSWVRPGRLVCHCLLIEAPEALILVDTGIGQADIRFPARLGLGGRLMRPVLDPAETARAQIEALGLDPRDLRHVLLTHLDLDHAGGIGDFPEAEVHVLAAELEAALKPSRHDSARYRAAQFSHGPRWRAHGPDGESWFGFTGIPVIPALADQLLLVPLPGHSRGHCGVAVRQGERWLLHAGDAFFHRDSLAQDGTVPAGLALVERADEVDAKARANTVSGLRQLQRYQPEITVFCSHDPVQFEQLAAG